jgi:hypothetical protein
MIMVSRLLRASSRMQLRQRYVRTRGRRSDSGRQRLLRARPCGHVGDIRSWNLSVLSVLSTCLFGGVSDTL